MISRGILAINSTVYGVIRLSLVSWYLYKEQMSLLQVCLDINLDNDII